jgi:hypothetical protein
MYFHIKEHTCSSSYGTCWTDFLSVGRLMLVFRSDSKSEQILEEDSVKFEEVSSGLDDNLLKEK